MYGLKRQYLKDWQKKSQGILREILRSVFSGPVLLDLMPGKMSCQILLDKYLEGFLQEVLAK